MTLASNGAGALSEFAKWAITEGAFTGGDLSGGEVQDMAVELGLLREVPYDPAQHGESEFGVEPGDSWFEFAGQLKDGLPLPAASGAASEPLTFTYRNWRGEVALRRVKADSVRFGFGSTEWHPEPQHLMSAFDLDKGRFRDFAAADIICFGPAPPPSVDGLDAGENGLPRPMAGAAEATIKALRAALRPFSQAILPDQTTLSGWRFGFEPSHDDFLHARAVYYGTDSVALQTAAERDVLAERRRQVEGESWTPEHDDQHAEGSLARAAACYAYQASFGLFQPPSHFPMTWPWSAEAWKPKDQRSDLVRAAALLHAEIERLDRAALEGKSNG